MRKKQPEKKTKKMQDLDRNFVVVPEVGSDQWRDSLEVFFDENETGLDHMRYLKDMSQTDIDNYYFTSGYEIYHLFPQKLEISLKPKKAKAQATRLGKFTMVYENTGCFRYAMPEEPAELEALPT